MGDMGDIFREMTAAKKERAQERLETAEEVASKCWTKHGTHHWSTTLNGERLDYWPSTSRFRYQGKTHFGGVEGFIAKRLKDKT